MVIRKIEEFTAVGTMLNGAEAGLHTLSGAEHGELLASVDVPGERSTLHKLEMIERKEGITPNTLEIQNGCCSTKLETNQTACITTKENVSGKVACGIKGSKEFKKQKKECTRIMSKSATNGQGTKVKKTSEVKMNAACADKKTSKIKKTVVKKTDKVNSVGAKTIDELTVEIASHLIGDNSLVIPNDAPFAEDVNGG